MREHWGNFISGFCKVEFLCWNGDPNWLGWAFIGIGGIAGLLVVLYVVALILFD